MTAEEEAEYQRLLVKFDEWKARGIKVPMASNQELEPLFDEALPLGSTVLVPALSQHWDHCIFEKDEEGFCAKGKYGIYRLAYGPNWYVTARSMDDTDFNEPPPDNGTR